MLIPATNAAQTVPTDNALRTRIDSVVHKHSLDYMHRDGAVGLSIGLIVQGHTYTYNYGELELGKRNLPTPHSAYCFGSIGKTFTGILLAQAVLDSKIDLQQDIRTYLLNGTDFTNLEFQGQPIRVVHLANHTSRVPNAIVPFPATWEQMTADEKRDFKVRVDPARFLAALRAVVVDTLPGSKYMYSGAGVRLLSMLLENVYKRPYLTLFRDYFTVGLGMTQTTIISRKADWTNFAFGSQNREEMIRNKSDFDDLTSAPGGVSTVTDMLKYLRNNLYESTPAIQLSHQETWDGGGRRIGLIWRLGADDRGRRRLFFAGRGLGNQALIAFYPGRRSGVVIFTNDTLPDSYLDQLSDSLLHSLDF